MVTFSPINMPDASLTCGPNVMVPVEIIETGNCGELNLLLIFIFTSPCTTKRSGDFVIILLSSLEEPTVRLGEVRKLILSFSKLFRSFWRYFFLDLT